jgi:hypothetical protein
MCHDVEDRNAMQSARFSIAATIVAQSTGGFSNVLIDFCSVLSPFSSFRTFATKSFPPRTRPPASCSFQAVPRFPAPIISVKRVRYCSRFVPGARPGRRGQDFLRGQPPRVGRISGVRPIRTPLKLPELGYPRGDLLQTRSLVIGATRPKSFHPHWIEVNILMDDPARFPRFMDDSLESSLQQRPFSSGRPVEPDRVRDIPPYRLAQV